MKMCKSVSVLLSVFIVGFLNAQINHEILNELKTEGSFKMKFKKAYNLMDRGNFEFALEIWKMLVAEQPQNYNINYQLGECYIQLGKNKLKALKYLDKAEHKISRDYQDGESDENEAPVETKFYLGIAYHLNSEFDKAIERFQSFRRKGGKYHQLYDAAGLAIAQSEKAKDLIKQRRNYLITNLGEPINSEYSDYNPAITADGNTMFFTSKRDYVTSGFSNEGIINPTDGKHFENVFVSYRNVHSGKWGKPEIMSFCKPNSNQASISTSPDGQFLFIKMEAKDVANLYLCERDDEKYSDPILMVENINSKSWETGATISADGERFYFVSDRPEGFGGGDIYRSKRLPNGEWGMPTNLGSSINTEYDEICPFIHPDGKTLFFSSNNKESMGGFDFFKSTRQSDTIWSEPVNLGYPLNTVDHDVSFSTMADGKTGYFSSEMGVNGLGRQDVYKVDLDTIVIEQVSILKGYIEMEDKKKLPGGIFITVSDVNLDGDYQEFKPNKRTGSYIFTLTPCREYLVQYTLKDVVFNEYQIKIPCHSGYQEIQKVINLKGVKLDN